MRQAAAGTGQAVADRSLAALRRALRTRFDLEPDPDDLAEAVEVGRRAVAACHDLTRVGKQLEALARLACARPPRMTTRISRPD